jgi:hypothetical protein
VEQRFCRGFGEILCVERGELAGKTWWSCGESVAEITANRHRKTCRLFAHFQIFENLMQIG